jgi:ABC-type oligopeptide transport system ATPase subunit
MTAPVLEVAGLVKHFPVQRGILRRTVAQVKAVDGVSFTVAPGETLCLVGESGCGKSTVARMIVRLTEPTSGTIRLSGVDVTRLSEDEMVPHRRRAQMVFQDPYASLNPKLRAGDIVAEPLENYGTMGRAEREAAVAAVLQKVGLRAEMMRRYPFEFSGGQRQRLGIARALALRPDLIVADEPVSALDVSVQAQVLNLLMDLQEEFGLSYLFVSHDLGVVEHIGHRIAVMYLGKVGRDRAEGRRRRRAAASLHQGADLRGTGAGSAAAAREAGHRGRRALADGPAVRLPFPHPLPLHHGALPGGGARHAGTRDRPPRRLPSAGWVSARLRGNCLTNAGCPARPRARCLGSAFHSAGLRRVCGTLLPMIGR